MLFKMTITKIAADGSQNKIELENGDAIQDQGALFDFLRPLITDEIAPVDIAKEPTSIITADKLQEDTLKVYKEPIKTPVVNRQKQDTPEKEVIRKVSERETGVVEIHCPACGLETAKHTPVTASYIHCPTCSVKLYLYPLDEVRGEPDALGKSFRANNIFYTAKERWEMKHGK